MCMCMCIFVSMCLCMCKRMCMSMYMYTFEFVCACVCVYVHQLVYVNVYVYVYVCDVALHEFHFKCSITSILNLFVVMLGGKRNCTKVGYVSFFFFTLPDSTTANMFIVQMSIRVHVSHAANKQNEVAQLLQVGTYLESRI
jgi:hypothetical protein